MYLKNQHYWKNRFVSYNLLKKLVEIVRAAAENDGKVNFVAVAQVLQVPSEVKI